MKNLTVKKIALGLFLAGYGVSSAFALDAATTVNTIVGTAPVMYSKNVERAHTMTLRIYQQETTNPVGVGKQVSVGDTVTITFDLRDSDGDVDNEKIKETFKVYIKNGSGAWADKTADITLKSVTDKESGTLSFRIPDSFSGADKIGYKLLERTEYGAPYANEWLQVTDIWDMDHDPNHTAPGDAKNPTTTGPTDAGDGDHGTGDGDEGNGTGPIINGTKTKIGIFKSTGGTVDPEHNYAASGATQIPQYGETFVAAVFDDENNDGQVDVGKTLKRTGYTYSWKLAGSYEPDTLNGTTGEAAVAASNDELTEGVTSSSGTNADTIFLGSENTVTAKHNTKYASTYKAGAQGYQLKVEAK